MDIVARWKSYLTFGGIDAFMKIGLQITMFFRNCYFSLCSALMSLFVSVKILFCKHYFSPLNTIMRKGGGGKDTEPDPFLRLMDPDLGSPEKSVSGSLKLLFISPAACFSLLVDPTPATATNHQEAVVAESLDEFLATFLGPKSVLPPPPLVVPRQVVPKDESESRLFLDELFDELSAVVDSLEGGTVEDIPQGQRRRTVEDILQVSQCCGS